MRLSKRELLNSLIVEGFDALPESERRVNLEDTMDLVSWGSAREINRLDSDHARYEDYILQVKKGFYRPIRVLPKEASDRFVLCI